MEFTPTNPIVKLCVQGMMQENKAAGRQLYRQAWEGAGHDFEKFLAAHFIAKYEKDVSQQLLWFETTLRHAGRVDRETIPGVFHTLHMHLAECHEALGHTETAEEEREKAADSLHEPLFAGPFFHGTKADLQMGDFLIPGNSSNIQEEVIMNHVYFTAIPSGAGLAAALAKGDGPQRVYVVAPTGPFENDPNLTDKKFPGNLTRSYRTAEPLKIVGEIKDWEKQSPESIAEWRKKLAGNSGKIIN